MSPRWGRAIGIALRDLLFPPRCAACEAALPSSASIRLCAACLDAVQPIVSPLCPRCGQPFQSRTGPDHLCGRCLTAPPVFDSARAFFAFSRPIRSLVHGVKYDEDGHALQALLELARPRLGEIVPPVDAVTPVPLHPARLRSRGFNQSLRLAGRLFDRTVVDGEMLERVVDTPPQTGLGRQDRRRNVKAAFRVRRRSLPPPARVLLVDDVYTTGATVDACARTLKRAGVREVHVLTLARAVGKLATE